MKENWSPELRSLTEIAEMKRIYTVINSSFKKDPVVIMGTSAVSGEGKTTITAGLAAAAAMQGGKRTLAMDLNWYAPALHRAFGLPAEDRRTNIRDAALQDLTRNSGHEHLDILPAVQHSGVEGDGENPVKFVDTMIAQARQRYDVIVLDTSKLFPTNRNMIDPVVIAGKADGVVLVVLGRETPRQQTKRAKVMLETAGANLIGVVMNNK